MTHPDAIAHLTPIDRAALDHALHDAAVVMRTDLRAIRVTGKDRAKYLHNMLTQDVTGLADGAVVPACLCDAQGKMLAVMTLHKEPTQIWLWTDVRHAEGLRDRLDRYVIMDECELTLEPERVAVTLTGPRTATIDETLGLPPGDLAVDATLAGSPVTTWRTLAGDARPGQAPVAERWLIVDQAHVDAVVTTLTAQGARPGTLGAVDALRILAGTPALGRDVEDGSLPIEVGLRAAVNYRKGCYVGQEAIAMMTYRGQLRRHLAWVDVLEGAPLPGWQLRTLDGKRAGKMGSAVDLGDGHVLGLATVQRKTFAAGVELVAEPDAAEATNNQGRPARVRVVATTTPDVFAAPEAT